MIPPIVKNTPIKDPTGTEQEAKSSQVNNFVSIDNQRMILNKDMKRGKSNSNKIMNYSNTSKIYSIRFYSEFYSSFRINIIDIYLCYFCGMYKDLFTIGLQAIRVEERGRYINKIIKSMLRKLMDTDKTIKQQNTLKNFKNGCSKYLSNIKLKSKSISILLSNE